MTSRQTRSQGSAPDIPLPTTSRHSSAHPSGTQTPTPPVSSTSQAQPLDPLFQNPLPFPLDPIMSDAGEHTRTDVRDTAPTSPSSPPSTSTSSVALSVPENTNPNYVMPLSDINKAFDSLTVLTGSENWKMWYFRVNNAIRVIRHQHFKSSGLHPGNTVKLACFNAITGKIDDKIMIHYTEESDAIELIEKLKQRFDPSSTVQESNELWKLFNLRKPVWEFDKLLDEAQDLWASIKKRDIDVSDQVFYSALVGIIPPHYHFVRSSYEATVDAAAATWDATTAAEGEKPVYRAVDLIARLKKEFTNYRLSNARTYPSKKSDKKSGSTSQGGAQRSDKSKGERANAAAPFQKPSDVKKDRKCFNCNKMGHTTLTCPEPWTEKSKEAMKKKGITKQSNKGKTKENASVAISMPASSSSQIATTSTSQSDWVQSISSSDVEMEDSETPVSHHISLPAFTAISDQDHTHIIDSGATIHCTPYLNLLFNIHTTPAITLTVANSEHLDLQLAGDMRVEIRKDNADYTFTFHDHLCIIRNDKDNFIGVIHESAKLYSITTKKLSDNVATLSLYELHKQTGHMSYTNLKTLLKTDKSIITIIIDDWTETQCEDCIINNIHRLSQRTSELAENFGDHFHIDIFGPLRTASIEGYKYWLTIVDDCTRWLILSPLKTKDEAYTQWVTFTTELFTQYGIKVKILQSDNDAVFTSGAFKNYLKAQGTIARYTVHDTPQQNGVAENIHQHIMNGIRVNLHTGKLPNRLWWHAGLYTMYILNRSPKTALKMQTPYFKRYGVNANLDNLHSFGTPCIVYDEARTSKLTPKGKRGVWLGFDDHSKGHYVYFGTKVNVERNLQFLTSKSQVEGELQNKNQEPLETTEENTTETPTSQEHEPEPMDVDEDETKQPDGPRRSKRIQEARGLLYDEVEQNIAFFLTEFNVYYADNVGDPISFKDVLNHPQRDAWFDSMKTEIESLESLGTWEYVKPPADANIIGSRFVYKTKYELGKQTKLKSRLVAQGFSQQEGIDYYANDIFAPVARMSSTRFILALAASLDYETTQIDIKSAYLYGNVTDEETLYLRPPPGNLLPNLPEGYVLKLRKTLYGLKQAVAKKIVHMFGTFGKIADLRAIEQKSQNMAGGSKKAFD
ncbi:hypothetical protein D9758_004567 [Tetrapyrgos nigripes]|uniref:Gag-pol polyprotein n=1 Tax=Tetrapyrgos nigripes TaxID=182062 RepID=A0A8H5H0F2_9AGAR|nr:hypothetical protein D9758_004567 [Tetrapyrgos nigripes]